MMEAHLLVLARPILAKMATRDGEKKAQYLSPTATMTGCDL
jgi:hypothetical protein